METVKQLKPKFVSWFPSFNAGTVCFPKLLLTQFNNIFRNQVAATRGEIVCISAYFVSLQVYMYSDLFCLVRVSHTTHSFWTHNFTTASFCGDFEVALRDDSIIENWLFSQMIREVSIIETWLFSQMMIKYFWIWS